MDPISRLVTTLKNAALARRSAVQLPYASFTEAVLKELKRAGYLAEVAVRGEGHRRTLHATLAYEKGAPLFTEVRRISKPSRRLYQHAGDIRLVRRGYGKLFLTTSKGVLTGEAARKAKLGGEPLFQMW